MASFFYIEIIKNFTDYINSQFFIIVALKLIKT